MANSAMLALAATSTSRLAPLRRSDALESSMKIVERFPRTVREIETEWIELSDGCRLAARLWLPEDAERDPVPAILEFLPYRRRDGTVIRDAQTHRYLAG